MLFWSKLSIALIPPRLPNEHCVKEFHRVFDNIEKNSIIYLLWMNHLEHLLLNTLRGFIGWLAKSEMRVVTILRAGEAI